MITLNSLEVLISKVFINSCINHDQFASGSNTLGDEIIIR